MVEASIKYLLFSIMYVESKRLLLISIIIKDDDSDLRNHLGPITIFENEGFHLRQKTIS